MPQQLVASLAAATDHSASSYAACLSILPVPLNFQFCRTQFFEGSPANLVISVFKTVNPALETNNLSLSLSLSLGVKHQLTLSLSLSLSHTHIAARSYLYPEVKGEAQADRLRGEHSINVCYKFKECFPLQTPDIMAAADPTCQPSQLRKMRK